MNDREKSCCNGELVCVSCAARRIGITPRTVKAGVRAGLLPGVGRLGTRIAFSAEAVRQASICRREGAGQGVLMETATSMTLRSSFMRTSLAA